MQAGYRILLAVFGLVILGACKPQADTQMSDAQTPTAEQQENTEPPRVLFVLSGHGKLGSTGKATGWFLAEAAHPWKVLREHGIAVDFLSPLGGTPPVTGMDLEDPINREFWENPEVQEKIQNTLAPREVDAADYAAIHYVGGHGAMWDLPDNNAIASIAANIYDKGGIVAAVCHGPAGLVNIRLRDGSYLLQGKKVAAFTNAEEAEVGLSDVVPFLLADKLAERGAGHVPAGNFQANVQVDGRLITGQNPQSAEGVGKAIAEALVP